MRTDSFRPAQAWKAVSVCDVDSENNRNVLEKELFMKRMITVLLSLSLTMGLCGVAPAGETEQAREAKTGETAEFQSLTEAEQGEECEWNVLLYLCGTDLESDAGAATLNLSAIAETLPDDGVNLLVETGGTKNWDPEEKLGFEIANDRLQRWYYGKDGYVLVDEAEESCMSNGQTLSDFIRWAAENYSAKKNMLILWDHGGGSNAGMICDENYGDTIMPLYAIEDALREGGTHFDLVMTDACLMASLEMGQALAPYADYLAASEEVMAGDGTNYKGWVQYLYDRPECSAEQLGKRICDYSQQYYMETDQKSTTTYFTMSLIDLSKIDAVAEAFNAFIHDVSGLVQDSEDFYNYARETYYTENYLVKSMVDLFDLSRRAEKGGISKEVTHALQDAVEDAVVYNLRSANHMYSHGLSVYYSLNDSDETLDHFARTSKNPEHLSFLDSINVNWVAPEWVYEKADRHPELDRSGFIVVPEIAFSEDRTKAYLTFSSGLDSVMTLSYALYFEDADYGVTYTLGESGNLTYETDEEQGTEWFKLGFDGTWPTLDGKPLCMSIADDTESYVLYHSPVKIQDEDMELRILSYYQEANPEEEAGLEGESEAGMQAEDTDLEEETDAGMEEGMETEEMGIDTDEKNSSYELLGLWDGFDAHSGLAGRNVVPISEIEGDYITLCDAVYSRKYNRISDYIRRMDTLITKDSVIENEKLPEGEYMIRFIARDVFNNAHYTDYFNVYWDGESISFE